jgi:thioredoxin reductase (NADPH)
MVANGITRLACGGQRYTVEMEGGPRASARTGIIASGATYHKPALDHLSAFEGAGVHCGTTPMEAQLCIGDEVIVVGGGNSAGQAAVFLADGGTRARLDPRPRAC